MINANPDCSVLFRSGEIRPELKLESIEFGEGFNTSFVMDMGGMFGQCGSLTSLDISNFNTANVTDMGGMFSSCHSLTSLDISNFNTANVLDMSEMFTFCSSLTSLNVSNFNTENVSHMVGMFEACSSLTSIDLSNFNTATAKVTDMIMMFCYCISLTNLNLAHFDMSHLWYWGENWQGKYDMCNELSTTSHYCTITCPLAVENAIKEINITGEGSYYYTGLPTSGVTFTWVRP